MSPQVVLVRLHIHIYIYRSDDLYADYRVVLVIVIDLLKKSYKTAFRLASFPGSRVGEEESCAHMHQVDLVTCILLRYTKLTEISVHLPKGHTAELYCL